MCRSLFIFSSFVNVDSQKNLLRLLLSGLLCPGFQHHGRSLFAMPAWHHWAQTYVAREAEDFFWIFSSPPAAYWMWSSQEEEQNKTWYILELASTSWLMFCLLHHMKTLLCSSLSATSWSLSKSGCLAVLACFWWISTLDDLTSKQSPTDWSPGNLQKPQESVQVKPLLRNGITKLVYLCHLNFEHSNCSSRRWAITMGSLPHSALHILPPDSSNISVEENKPSKVEKTRNDTKSLKVAFSSLLLLPLYWSFCHCIP